MGVELVVVAAIHLVLIDIVAVAVDQEVVQRIAHVTGIVDQLDLDHDQHHEIVRIVVILRQKNIKNRVIQIIEKDPDLLDRIHDLDHIRHQKGHHLVMLIEEVDLQIPRLTIDVKSHIQVHRHLFQTETLRFLINRQSKRVKIEYHYEENKIISIVYV